MRVHLHWGLCQHPGRDKPVAGRTGQLFSGTQDSTGANDGRYIVAQKTACMPAVAARQGVCQKGRRGSFFRGNGDLGALLRISLKARRCCRICWARLTAYSGAIRGSFN